MTAIGIISIVFGIVKFANGDLANAGQDFFIGAIALYAEERR